MKAIVKQEFWWYIKSFKAISILLFFYLSTILSSYFFSNNQNILESHGANVDITSNIKFFIFILGPTLVSAVFYDIFNKETELKTMRLLITKTSLLQIFIGKITAVLLFWLVTLVISFSLVSIYSFKYYWTDFINAFSCILLSGSFVVFLSIIFDRGNKSLLAGVLIGVAFPILGFISSLFDSWYWSVVSLIFPYYSSDLSLKALVVPSLVTLVILCFSYFILKRKDF